MPKLSGLSQSECWELAKHCNNASGVYPSGKHVILNFPLKLVLKLFLVEGGKMMVFG